MQSRICNVNWGQVVHSYLAFAIQTATLFIIPPYFLLASYLDAVPRIPPMSDFVNLIPAYSGVGITCGTRAHCDLPAVADSVRVGGSNGGLLCRISLLPGSSVPPFP